MRVGYIGNFDPPHSTENHVAQALRSIPGVEFQPYQESQPRVWHMLAKGVFDACNILLWTRTGWDWPHQGISVPEIHELQYQVLASAWEKGIPTVGFHLDRWWGLSRQHEINSEPFFKVSTLITADGGHEQNWKDAGVNHVWMPPAVSEFECVPGERKEEYVADLAFCGSWQPGYHAEWTHRPQLIDHLRQWGCEFWPRYGQDALRGKPLRDLYASVKVLVGDSCLYGDQTHYWSDRIPETLGRGGFLIHPNVEGLEDHFEIGKHLVTWDTGDWSRLHELIALYKVADEERKRIAEAGRDHVLANHTYTKRMRDMIELVT